MCGIAGVYGQTGASQESMLRAMNACLSHRGPDEQGIHLDGPVGLAHKRLSIIGIDNGRQPIFNEDGSVCVIFNGEIYNYSTLKEKLSSAGHNFNTETDTEIIVHLYEEHGQSFVEQLEGMFAFALWDSETKRLLLARDPMGIKPLVLADDGDSIAFASELPAVLESGVNHGGIDETAISQYFSLGHIPAPRTAFENVRKLEPGEQVIISDGNTKRSQFYTPTVKSRDTDFQTAVDGLRTRVEDAVEKRLMSDVPLGAFLSGGIDSSIVVGIMADLVDEPVKTFTVGFDEALFDESWAAQEVADYHDTDHTEFTVSPDDVRAAIPAVLDRLGEPFADQSLVPTYIVSRETSHDVKVALSGDGADELFAGYSRYRGEYYSKYYRQIPTFIRNSVIEPAVDRLDVSREDSRGEQIRKLKKFLRGGEPRLTHRHFEWSRIANDGALAGATRLAAADEGHASIQKAHSDATSYLPTNRQDGLSRIQAVDTRFGLPNQILHKTDKASMYNSLEVRVPFLDTRVVEYALSLPTSYKITAREQKRVLKHAFDDVLPTAILERGKQGFDMPIGEWFKHELEEEFRDTVAALDSDLIDTGAALRHHDAHKRGTAEHSKHLWSVYVFARWHNRMRNQGII